AQLHVRSGKTPPCSKHRPSPTLQGSIAKHAHQTLPMRLPGSKAQLRFEKAKSPSSYYVIPSEAEESQNFVWLLPIRSHSPSLRLTGRYFRRVRRISNSFFKASTLIACCAE